jgi:uncharacterized membrane protein
MLAVHRATKSAGFNLDRLAAFSDGVIAIAITILVLGLEVPSVHEVTKNELVDFLRAAVHPALGFVISFVVIGTYWMEHYAIFHFLTHATRPLVALNGLFLLSLSFLPFPTGLQAAYRHDELAMVLYGVAQLLCGLSLVAMWAYAIWDRRLVDPRISPDVVRSMTRRLLIAPAISLLAIACSFVSIPLSRLIFLSIPCFYLSHRFVDTGLHQARLDNPD